MIWSTCLLALYVVPPAPSTQEPSSFAPSDHTSVPGAVLAPDGTAYVRGELLLQFEPGLSLIEMRARVSASGASVRQELPTLRVLHIQLPEGSEAPTAMARYRSLPGVARVELNAIGGIGACAAMPTIDTHYGSQWQLDNTTTNLGTPGADIQARAAWAIEAGDPAVVLAILDSGLRSENPEFVGRTRPGWDFVNNDADPWDDHTHGTLVAGLAAATSGNGFGVAGVDGRCTILPIKVLNQAGSGAVSWLLSGLNYAAQQEADVINLSLINYPISGIIDAALEQCRNAGCIILACAGNGSIGNADVSYPGASPWTLSIGATDASDLRADFSGTGAALDFVAPGKLAVTVNPHGPDSYYMFSGCSAATPVAAGIVCLLKAQDPGLTHQEAFELLRTGAQDRVGDGEDGIGRDDDYGWGRLSALQSLAPLYQRYCSANPNSTGAAATLTASGSSRVDQGDLFITASLLPTDVLGYFLVSQTQGWTPAAGGSQGNLCLAGNIGRFRGQIQSSSYTGSFRIRVDLTQLPTWPTQAILPGETWHFSAWFRDSNPGPTSNFADALSVLFE